MLGPRARKVLLIVHLAVSVGWMGAAASYVAINVYAFTGTDQQTIRSAYLVMPVIARGVLVPLAVATVVTGVALALGTSWGLMRHYWVTISLGIATFAAAILILHLPAIDSLAAKAGDPNIRVSDLGGDLFHSLGGLIVLTVPLVLNVTKPRGLTRYGWRAQRRRQPRSAPVE
jgi:hypothetical protein